MTDTSNEGPAAVQPGVYFEGVVWGAAAALLAVGLIEGLTLASALGFAGLIFQTARFLRWLARVSPKDS